MPHFVEELATQHLWYWMRNNNDWTVDGEVLVDTGRVDLAAKTTSGEYIGIELKSNIRFETSSTVSEQVDRYMSTGAFDRFYVASPYATDILDTVSADQLRISLPVVREACYALGTGISEDRYSKQEVLDAIHSEVPEQILEYNPGGNELIRDYIDRKLEFDRDNDPISINEGLRQIKSASLSEDIGIIEVPLSITDGQMENPSRDLIPDNIRDPQVLVESAALTRHQNPTIQRDSEPWVRHHTWSAFGGIPEGHIPNTMDSNTVDRPIDILSYQETFDPTKILQNSTAGDVIGIEAKGSDGVDSQRTVSQLRQFLETRSLSRLYLAIPDSQSGTARSLLRQHPELDEKVGIITVGTSGNVSISKDAAQLELAHDGYERQRELHKTGFGEITTPGMSAVKNPFRLSEWRETPVDKSGNPVVWSADPREYIPASETETSGSRVNLAEQGLNEHPNQETLRAYLLQGMSAAPKVRNNREPLEAKRGYVRLTVSTFETESGDVGVDLHFGAGSYEGGYIRVAGDGINQLCSVFASVHNVGHQTATVSGRAIDLETYTAGSTEFKLKGDKSLSEEELELSIEAVSSAGIRMRLCKKETKGVSVVATEAQSVDLLRCLRIARYGRTTQIPNNGSYKRIGPDGNDTWEKGAAIEKSHIDDFEIEL